MRGNSFAAESRSGTAVGRLLREWRVARGLSQMELAMTAGFSARHVSFIETGRSRPSREAILVLAEALDVPLRQRNRLLESGGYAAAYRQTPIDSDAMGRMRDVLQLRPYVYTRDGERLFWKEWGKGRAVLFVAAWGLPSDMWDYQMVPLSEQGLRCVAYDRRGHGRSSHAGSGYGYDTLADDLASIIEAADLYDVTLVGMSMASGEIVRYLTRHGHDRVAKIVFVATAATPFPMKTADNPNGIPAEQFEHFRRNMLMRDYPKWLEDNRPPFFLPETSPQMQEWVRMMMLGTSLKALVECNRSSTSTDFREELRKIAVPTLLIHGDRDVTAPLVLTGKPTAELIPGARLSIYEGAPHGLMVTHAARLNAELLAFVNGE